MSTATESVNLSIILSLINNNKLTIKDSIGYINIVVERKNRVFTNKFDDTIYWIWKDNTNTWNLKSGKCTSKAGKYYVENPFTKLGTGVLKEGFYRDSHKLGLHQGKYTALVQAKKLPVWRDDDKDEWIDYVKDEEGLFGINIHRANPNIESTEVNKWSAACIVFANPIVYNSFISQCKKHEQLHGNLFSINLVSKK